LRTQRQEFFHMARNACELEIDLFCHGVVVPSNVSLAGRRMGSRTVERPGPTIGSAMADWAPPQYEEMRRVIAHVYEACHANWKGRLDRPSTIHRVS
jgi:hypothetical protein